MTREERRKARKQFREGGKGCLSPTAWLQSPDVTELPLFHLLLIPGPGTHAKFTGSEKNQRERESRGAVQAWRTLRASHVPSQHDLRKARAALGVLASAISGVH